jgi:hypothetical protein
VRHFKIPKEFEDTESQFYFYKQIEQNILNEYYPCTEKLAVSLASYSVQILFGNYDPNKHKAGYLK